MERIYLQTCRLTNKIRIRIREQKPEIHHLVNVTNSCGNFVHLQPQPTYYHPKTMVCYESTPGDFKTTKLLENPWTAHITFIESVMLDSDLTCAYRVLACGGA